MSVGGIELSEGAVRIHVDAEGSNRGPGARTSGVFYNRAATPNRDVSVLFLAAHGNPERTWLDALCGSGVRGIRWHREACGRRITLVDSNPKAVERASENALLSGAQVEIVRSDLRAYLSRTLWDHIDVDPFGSPAPFVDAALAAIRIRGTLAVTATDGAVLAGAKPGVAVRRYGGASLRCDAKHEIALRLLASFVIRQAAVHDRAARPVFAHANDHYDRIYFELSPGAGRADDLLAQIALAVVCAHCGWRSFTEKPRTSCPECGCGVSHAGPLFSGSLHDSSVVAAMGQKLQSMPWAESSRRKAESLLTFIAGESRLAGFPVELATITRSLKISPPPLATVLASIGSRGYRAVRVHTGEASFKSDAPWSQVRAAVLEASKMRPSVARADASAP